MQIVCDCGTVVFESRTDGLVKYRTVIKVAVNEQTLPGKLLEINCACGCKLISVEMK